MICPQTQLRNVEQTLQKEYEHVLVQELMDKYYQKVLLDTAS